MSTLQTAASEPATESGLVEFGHIIDGKEVQSTSGEVFTSIDPYTREPWAVFPLGSNAEADLAVAAARRAFDEGPWPRMTASERRTLLHRFADLIELHGEELAMADTRDMGKPITQSLSNDVSRTALNFRRTSSSGSAGS